jgi:hypothetical protein
MRCFMCWRINLKKYFHLKDKRAYVDSCSLNCVDRGHLRGRCSIMCFLATRHVQANPPCPYPYTLAELMGKNRYNDMVSPDNQFPKDATLKCDFFVVLASSPSERAMLSGSRARDYRVAIAVHGGLELPSVQESRTIACLSSVHLLLQQFQLERHLFHISTLTTASLAPSVR